MKIETHVKQIEESLSAIHWAVENGAEKHERSIGFHTSAAAADMLEIYLHKLSLIDTGFMIKPEWIKSKNAIETKLPLEFPHKKELLELLQIIEEKRNTLCYGTRQSKEVIQSVLNTFYKVKTLLKEEGINEF